MWGGCFEEMEEPISEEEEPEDDAEDDVGDLWEEATRDWTGKENSKPSVCISRFIRSTADFL